jgi:hypothetical protein
MCSAVAVDCFKMNESGKLNGAGNVDGSKADSIVAFNSISGASATVPGLAGCRLGDALKTKCTQNQFQEL